MRAFRNSAFGQKRRLQQGQKCECSETGATFARFSGGKTFRVGDFVTSGLEAIFLHSLPDQHISKPTYFWVSEHISDTGKG